MQPNVLILGGTTEARELAAALAGSPFATTVSLAGRTAAPAAQAAPVRVGGFGGAEGLAAYLQANHVDFLIDATHPYADTISAHAALAAARTCTPILGLRRPPWQALDGDFWVEVADAEAAVRALGRSPRRVFLAVGRQELSPFGSAPQHHYFIRSVDPVDPPLGVPHATYILGRGPFSEASDQALLAANTINAIVAKNSGGTATYSKIAAARSLGIPIFMFKRPLAPDCPAVATVAEAIDWLYQAAGLEVPRGV